MKVLITGSREWLNYAAMVEQFDKLPLGTTIVHGHCPRGADAMADGLAKKRGFEVRRYPANWDRFGKGAGPIRNQEMIDKEHPDKDGVLIDFVLAFSINLAASHGTKDCVQRAKAKGLSVTLVTGR